MGILKSHRIYLCTNDNNDNIDIIIMKSALPLVVTVITPSCQVNLYLTVTKQFIQS